LPDSYRLETDLLGERQVPAPALYGIHTDRALENFPLTGRRVNPALIHAYGAVKLACVRTNVELGYLPPDPSPPGRGAGGEGWSDALEQACHEMMEGLLDDHIVVDALQGGAGTSTNMNVNEVLANRALQLMGLPLGGYVAVSPLDHVNLHQSTNDTYPTALKVAAITLLRELERDVIQLLEEFQRQERATAGVVKVGRTQLQDAVLTTVGREMSAYAEAFARDRWRIFKCEERLRVVNLGGTAIGTGLAAPRRYIFRVIEHLRDLTHLGLARAENMVEATQNTDVFVEVSGILKACASNLLKIASDIRLLSSGPDAGFGDIRIPPRQPGSSIMPGKVNPVIPEAVNQVAFEVIGNDLALTLAAEAGQLQLNVMEPLIAYKLFDSIRLLQRAMDMLREHCVNGISANEAHCRQLMENSIGLITALNPYIGYENATRIAGQALLSGRGVLELVREERLLDEATLADILRPENMIAPRLVPLKA